MLEADMSTNVLPMCLKNPTDAPAIVKSMKKEILSLILEHSCHLLPPIPWQIM